MRQLREDNNGFVNFPIMDYNFNKSLGKTLVYIVAFGGDKEYLLSNVFINIHGGYLTDDISGNCIKLSSSNNEIEDGYFPEVIIGDNGVKKLISIPIISSVCIGWHNDSFVYKENNMLWFSTFRELTNEGRKLYYSLKKLHNNKEVRILTFNCVK